MFLDGDRASLLKTLQPLMDLSSRESIIMKDLSAVKKSITATLDVTTYQTTSTQAATVITSKSMNKREQNKLEITLLLFNDYFNINMFFLLGFLTM